MIHARTEREMRRLRRIASRFEREGFDVLIEPKGAAVPRWLRSFSPDLIAVRGDERVVVDVRSRQEAHGDDGLRRLAEAIENHPSWRLELDISNPRESAPPKESPAPLANRRQVREELEAAVQLMQSDLYVPALLLAWAGFEGAAREAMAHEDIELTPMPTASLLKTLVTFGYIDANMGDRLSALGAARNHIAHGSAPSQSLRPADIAVLLETAEQLMDAE